MATRPLVGLALGGGVMRAMAHIGVLKVLKEAGIPIDMVAGTSAGSIVAALYASGHSPERIEEIALELRSNDLFDYGSIYLNLLLIAGDVISRVLHLPYPLRSPLGLMRGNRIETLVNKHVGRNRLFGQTEIPLGITAVDVRDGTLVVFLEGLPAPYEAHSFMAVNTPEELRRVIPPADEFVKGFSIALAVRASVAIPGIFEPVRFGERILVDGGVRENVPAYVLRRMGADFVIAVDVGYGGRGVAKVGNIFKLLTQSFEIVISEGINLKLEGCADVEIRPIINADPWDITRARHFIRQGELAATEVLDDIKRKLYN
ncbi:NTE family protein RssA [Sporotomaculum syntrophicum]|uniref:NTE family protein RssA n=1 Tax=Sporotomaculum syntrophicum TaxID=182264 RepID=A0A9D2WNT0_9FIRM|nr:patatin-like phospholipase family protein [Sporotomaculum syntrophicum]KAF1084872.1 NTE family protein RssA [Sporotomaculum syntrophicum]